MPYFKRIHEVVSKDQNVLETLHDEYIEYQLLPDSEIPINIWEDSNISPRDASKKKWYRMDMIWDHLRETFPLLSEFALTVLTVPHSNTTQERVFSMVRKNKTEFRSNLDMNIALNSILQIKMTIPESLCPCFHWKPSKDLLRESKKSTWEYNKEHSTGKIKLLNLLSDL